MMNNLSLADRTATLANGLQAAYYDSGALSGGEAAVPADAAVVLLHGFCGSSAYWEQLVPKITGLGRIIAPDLRGHGSSSAPEAEVYAMEQFAEDLALLLQELGVRQIALFGHSLGGYISLAFAERYPQLLRSFSLVHSTAMTDDETARQRRDKAAGAILAEGIGPFVEELVPKLFAPAHVSAMADQVRRMTDAGRGTSPGGAAATARGMKARPDRQAVLSGLKVPALLVAGKEDGVIPPAKTFTAAGAAVTQTLLDDCGHMGMIEAPEALAGEIVRFVKRVFA